MMKTKVWFIINPISGRGKHTLERSQIENHFPESTYTIEVHITQYKLHAHHLAQMAVAQKVDMVVACGGDGTINEVASALVNTGVTLGCIPLGSGNGFASHLRMPSDISRALCMISDRESTRIDIGKIDDSYFFSNMGIGFDAEVIHRHKRDNRNPFLAYLKAVLNAFKNYPFDYNLTFEIGNETHKIQPFMFFISNSNQMGYNFSLTPKASLNDGKLDLVIIKRSSRLSILTLGILLLFKMEKFYPGLQYHSIENLEVAHERNEPITCQKDGELFPVSSDTIRICVIPNALNVISNI
ncbi:diacylglycerol/lipid kinase family protein [Robertkochia solimangrovi]|uniref:diacylglycerol/lipid kinase family protein n=1 Tax=Robertkochia solimangrovi TaxID=2213046 RepID=UPI0013A5843E|nr:diacylglycerol kinase family protein [Robertkochia solimangrovi]